MCDNFKDFGESMKGFINIKYIKSTFSWDVLFVDSVWGIKRGFLFNNKEKLQCLVDGEVFEDGEVLLVSPYTGLLEKQILKKLDFLY